MDTEPKSSKTGSFSPTSFTSRMMDLDNSQQSIEVLSLWVQHHRSQAPRAVQTWYRLFKTLTEDAKKLQLLYLANDVVQNSRKRGLEFQEQFSLVIVKSIQHAVESSSKANFLNSLRRLIKIWKERRVFDQKIVDQLYALTKMESSNEKSNAKASKADNAAAVDDSRTDEYKAASTSSDSPPSKDDLVELLTWLQTVASTNTKMQADLEALPAELSHVSKLATLKPEELMRLRGQIEKASELLRTYEERLDSESKRRRVALAKLRAFAVSQEAAQRKDEALLAEHRATLDRVTATCDELRKHVASLPDVNALMNTIQITNLPI